MIGATSGPPLLGRDDAAVEPEFKKFAVVRPQLGQHWLGNARISGLGFGIAVFDDSRSDDVTIGVLHELSIKAGCDAVCLTGFHKIPGAIAFAVSPGGLPDAVRVKSDCH